jgi:hypothetical protein
MANKNDNLKLKSLIATMPRDMVVLMEFGNPVHKALFDSGKLFADIVKARVR